MGHPWVLGGGPHNDAPSSPNLQAAVLLEQERQQQEMAKMAPPVPRPPPEVAPMGARAPLPPRGERCAPPPP